MNKKYKVVIIAFILFIVIIGIVLGLKHIVKNKEENRSKEEHTLELRKCDGLFGLEDGIEWSYIIDLNNKKVTKYCLSSGLIASEELIKEYGLDKRTTRPLLEEEAVTLNNIFAQKDKYKVESYPEDPGYILYADEVGIYISDNDINARVLKSITEHFK